MKKKSTRNQLRKGISNIQSKYYCSLSVTEHVFFDKVRKKLTKRNFSKKHPHKRRSVILLKLAAFLKGLVRIVKHMF